MLSYYRRTMTYLILILATVIVCSHVSFADSTFVCGTIAGETWTRDGSPYMVTCDIEVASLTIKPGVSVLFTGNYHFRINGILTAVGTVLDSIIFARANSSIGWKGIKMTHLAPGTEFAFCRIDGSTERGLTIVNCPFANITHCTISHNSMSTQSTSMGGGVYAEGVLTLVECVVRNNGAYVGGNFIQTYSYGGGIYSNGSLTLSGCTIENNEAIASTCYGSGHSYGGGIYSDGALRLSNCRIHSNTANGGGGPGGVCWGHGYGGGLYIADTCIAINSIIDYNTVAGFLNEMYGGGIYIYSGIVTLVNNTIAFNVFDGINISSGTAEIVNSIVFWNTRTQVAGSATISYSCIEDGDILDSNIAFNPNFENDTTLIITIGSPCIDRGNPDPLFDDVCFPPSLPSARNDMGAHGGPDACGWIKLHYISGTVYEGCWSDAMVPRSGIMVALKNDLLESVPFRLDTTDADGIYFFDSLQDTRYYIYLPAQDTIVDRDTIVYTLGSLTEDVAGKNIRYCNAIWSDITNVGESALPTEFSLSQNHPNPFNPSTTIEFALPRRADVELSVYNILGQQLRTLLDENKAAGAYSITWDGTDQNGGQVASGIYFYRLVAGDFVQSKKMLLTK